MPKKKVDASDQYQKKSPREHVLLRPDTYVGSVERDKEKMFVMDEAKACMVEEEVEFVPALYKIFDEILVNAADNKQRDDTMREIRVKIDIDAGSITVKNDGKGIPVQIHREHGMYIPELIFGNLLTSSNYNDADLKTVGGRNGFGAKLANIFSTKFILETVDSENGKKYTQTWRDNMSDKGEPVIIDCSARAKDYTKITFFPDFPRFGMSSFANEQILKMFIKRVYDIAGTTSSDLKVHLYVKGGGVEREANGPLPVRTFIDYAKLYIGPTAKLKSDYFHHTDNEKWEFILAIAPQGSDYRQVSHVNNIWTIKGGAHVKYIENQFVKFFKDNFKDKQKKIKEMLKPKMIKDHLWIFINAKIVNPAFSSQTKETLTTKTSNFGSVCKIPDDINKRMMTKIKMRVKEFLNFKLDQAAKKTDGTRKSRLNLPPEIDDANHAGKTAKMSAGCTLIVTEGLSAKTLAVAGVTELPGSKNKFGIFPLKGKLLNVREAPKSQVNKNAEITNLKQILGLRHGIKYDNKKTIGSLRYGKVMIMTDQDYDGSHIKGLVVNLFHSQWPELIHCKLFGANGDESFVEQFITPIVVVSRAKKKIAFYTIPQYEEWKSQNNDGKGWKSKYFKGLGTWQRKDGKEHFKNLAKHRIAFQYTHRQDIDPQTGHEAGNENDNAIVKAFAKDKADARKDWIANCAEGTTIDFGNIRRVSYKDFIDKELILFSVSDLHRSVPSLYDGLKPGQRKLLYCCFLKNNLKTELRVAQLGGYVSEKSAYHHGEQSLYMTIIGMAQDYVGSNNINLLKPNGMFGSRMRGGKDAASPRYINTALASITRNIFIEDDDMILEYQDDDGYPVEPKHYKPIIPMVLVNGAMGIGTGWSTSIPNYNPADIIRNIRRKLSGEDWLAMHPFYRGYNGNVSRTETGYLFHGKAEIVSCFESEADGSTWSTIQVTELPIQHWTENYKKYLMDLEAAEQIANVNNMSSDIDISFTFDIQHKVRAKVTKKGRGKKAAVAESEAQSGSTSPQRGGSSNSAAAAAKKACKKKLYFNGSIEDEVFLKDMRLVSSKSTNNMVLFDSNHQIKRYSSPAEILQEFYDARIAAYSARKRAMLAAMEHKLSKITNQARFIMMIVNDELQIAKRGRAEVVADLKARKFEPWQARKGDGNTLKNRAKSTDAFDEEERAKAAGGPSDAAGYKYLLSMSLSCLTKEKVEELLATQEALLAEVRALQKKSVKDLWRNDLDALEGHLDEYRTEYEQNVAKMRAEAEAKRVKAKLGQKTKGGKGKKRVTKKRVTKGKAAANSNSNAKRKLKSESSSTNSSAKSSVASSVEPEVTKGMKGLMSKKGEAAKATKNTASKPRKKKALSKGSGVGNPFSRAKKVASKFEADSDDSDISESPSAMLSLADRLKMKANGGSRKRPRATFEDDDPDLESIDDFDEEPPRKRRNTASETSSDSSMPLKPRSGNGSGKRQLKRVNAMADSESESEEYVPKPKKKRVLKKKQLSDDDFDIDDGDSDDDDENSFRAPPPKKRAMRKKVVKHYADPSSSPEDSDEDLEINESDGDGDDSEYCPY